MSLGKWILGGLGFAVGGPIGALIGVFIASLFDSSHTIEAGEHRQGIPHPGRSHTTQGDIRVSIIVLLACVIKADGRVLKAEINTIKPFLLRNFGEEGAKQALQLLKQLLSRISTLWRYRSRSASTSTTRCAWSWCTCCWRWLRPTAKWRTASAK